MFPKRIACLLALVACLVGLAVPGIAAEVDSDSVYCFSSEDFSQQADPLTGICIVRLPDPAYGTVMMGARVVQTGDIFPADQLSALTFCPVRTQQDGEATVGYLPVYEDRVEKATELTISIRGKQDKAPVAKDLSLETYKNIPNEGVLKVTDPEGQPLTFTITRQPRRGEVVVAEDGTFTYTPKKNKVGVDSFTFTAADPAGNVSREATVTVRILKPTQAETYGDTLGLDCRFEAEWLRNTGLFVGEQVGGSACFYPEKAVSGGQFLAMLMESLELPQAKTDELQQVPQWLRPYLAAAQRSGLVDAQTFAWEAPITGTEAAMLLQRALELPVPTAAEDITAQELALSVVNDRGFALAADQPITRAAAAELFYHLSQTHGGK